MLDRCMLCGVREDLHDPWVIAHRFLSMDPIKNMENPEAFDPIDGFPLFGDDDA